MKEDIIKNKIRKSKEDKIFDFIIYSVAALLILITLYPMYFIVIASISNPTDVSSGNIIFWPKGINFRGYEQLLNYKQLWVGYKNTIIYAVLGTCMNLIVNISASYALSRKNLVGKKLITFFYLVPMFFGGGLIPSFFAVIV